MLESLSKSQELPSSEDNFIHALTHCMERYAKSVSCKSFSSCLRCLYGNTTRNIEVGYVEELLIPSLKRSIINVALKSGYCGVLLKLIYRPTSFGNSSCSSSTVSRVSLMPSIPLSSSVSPSHQLG